MPSPEDTQSMTSEPTINTESNVPTGGAVQPAAPASPSELPPAALDLAAKLFDLARNGENTTLQQYLSAGVPKNLTNASGDTLLMLASYHGHTETVKMLTQSGADVNVLNARGQSIIAGAVFKGYDEVVRALFENGADVMLGQPNAIDCARMFKREACLGLFGIKEEGTTIPVES